MIKHLQKSSFPFETFIQIFRPFIMGKYAIESIDQAFALLDQDKSGNIDITELSSFIPLIRNDANPHQIIDYIQKKRF
jgi:Ca2+-binding EF-hand superfamily protein